MEPVRGGKLVSLPAKAEEKLRSLRPDATTVSWAFRFLQSIPGVVLTLSGMSDLEQLKANVATYETNEPLSEDE
jgi:predicted aldo/keto reductase-like oxidoreductase